MRIVKHTGWMLACVAGCALGAFAQTAPAPKSGTPAPGTASAAKPTAPERAPGLYMTFQTDMGDVACKLYENEAPVTVRTMVGLAIGKISYIDPVTGTTTKKRFFDGLTFHRVIPMFMIQGGDPLGTGTGGPKGPGFPYKNEPSPNLQFDVPGRLAMANAGPNTNASQFFITEVAYASLNGNYTIWGQCDNVDVVKAIARVPRDASDKPRTAVHMKRVVVERVGPAPANAPEAMPRAASGAAPAKKPATPASKPKASAKPAN